MREMKDSGIEWIGNIPSNWTRTKIKNICSLIGSGTTPASHNQDYYEGDINWIQSGDLYGTSIINNTQKKISTKTLESFSSLKLYKPPFISIAMYGASVGNLAISTIKACCNQAVCCLKTNDNIVKNNYLFYWLNISKTDFLSMAEGGTQPNISQQKIRNQYIYIPRIVEQQKIADFLDEKCAEIDALTSDIQTQIETLEEYKKSVITEAVTKGLDPNVEMKDSGVEWIGKIPANWTVIKIKYLSNEVNQKKLMNTDSMYSYLGLENLKSYSDEIIKTKTDYDEGIQKFCHKGNVLFSKLRPYLAKVMICPYDTFATSEFLELSPSECICDANYLKYSMLNSSFINEVNLSTYGAKMPRADASYIKNIKICITNLDEQHRIADFLDQKCSEIDQTISEKQQQLETLAEYKKSLIYEYVTGKKEVA